MASEQRLRITVKCTDTILPHGTPKVTYCSFDVDCLKLTNLLIDYAARYDACADIVGLEVFAKESPDA